MEACPKCGGEKENYMAACDECFNKLFAGPKPLVVKVMPPKIPCSTCGGDGTHYSEDPLTVYCKEHLPAQS